MIRVRRAASAAIALCSLSLSSPTAIGGPGGFVAGDLYLYSPAIYGIGSGSGALVRIDPTTGQTASVTDFTTTPSYSDMVAYDPFRKRLVCVAQIQSTSNPTRFVAIDAAGGITDLHQNNVIIQSLAPTGDGRIYLRRTADTTASIRYLDAANRMQTLMDSSGTQPFLIEGNAFFPNHSMLFDPPTNSLVVASYAAAFAACSGGSPIDVNVRRIPLSGDGTRVSGAVLCSQFSVDLTSGNEQPVGLSHLPGGDLLLVVDTNSNAQQYRMLRIDPVSLVITPFAANSHPFAAATNAGTWSSRLGKAIVLDTGNDVLRAFSDGEVGPGITIQTSIPISASGSSGEFASMIEIPVDPCGGAMVAYGKALAGSGGFAPALYGTGCASPGSAMSVEIDAGLGGAGGLLLLGPQAASIPFAGGTLHLSPIAISVALVLQGTSGAAGQGALSLPAALPNDPNLIGVTFVLQALFDDSGAPQGVSMTNGLAIEIG